MGITLTEKILKRIKIIRVHTDEFTVTPQAIKDEVCEILKCNGEGH
jgi:L-lysine 2,3-aminomutase